VSSEATPPDPCVVEIDGLAVLVQGFVEQWTRQHPPTTDSLGRPNGGSLRDGHGYFAGRDPDAPPTAVEVLAARTRRLDVVHGVGVPSETIQRVLDRGDRTVDLGVADALATAVRRPDAFHGRPPLLRLEPSPATSSTVREFWVSEYGWPGCCGSASRSAGYRGR